MVKICKKLIFALLVLNISLVALAIDLPVTNGTGCLYNAETNTMTYVKPIPFYIFVGNENKLIYSGVEVDPGEQNVKVPLGTSYSVNPPMPAAFIGTSPGDAPAHITINVPGSLSLKVIIQVISGGACSANYPCAMTAIGNQSQQCATLLQKMNNGSERGS